MHPVEIEAARATLETSERFVSRRYEHSPGAPRLSWEWIRVETLGINVSPLRYTT